MTIFTYDGSHSLLKLGHYQGKQKQGKELVDMLRITSEKTSCCNTPNHRHRNSRINRYQYSSKQSSRLHPIHWIQYNLIILSRYIFDIIMLHKRNFNWIHLRIKLFQTYMCIYCYGISVFIYILYCDK